MVICFKWISLLEKAIKPSHDAVENEINFSIVQMLYLNWIGYPKFQIGRRLFCCEAGFSNFKVVWGEFKRLRNVKIETISLALVWQLVWYTVPQWMTGTAGRWSSECCNNLVPEAAYPCSKGAASSLKEWDPSIVMFLLCSFLVPLV